MPARETPPLADSSWKLFLQVLLSTPIPLPENARKRFSPPSNRLRNSLLWEAFPLPFPSPWQFSSPRGTSDWTSSRFSCPITPPSTKHPRASLRAIKKRYTRIPSTASSSRLPLPGPSPIRIPSIWSAVAATTTPASRMCVSLLCLLSFHSDPITGRSLLIWNGPRTKGAALCNPRPPCSAACPHSTSFSLSNNRRSEEHTSELQSRLH